MIRIHRPEIIGMQESLINQIKVLNCSLILHYLLKILCLLNIVPLLKDLEKLLGERYKWIGWGRNDGKSSGEFCPIVYRSDLFTVYCQRTKYYSVHIRL
jgi:hypothetical protein